MKLLQRPLPALACLGMSIVWLVGCDTSPDVDYDKLNLVDASGTILLDGKPLADANVIFEDAENRTYSWGRTDSEGEYSLRLDSDMTGVTPGEKIVRITTVGNPGGEEEGGEEAEADGDQQPARKTETLPAKYHSNSELTVTVTADRNDYSFELE